MHMFSATTFLEHQKIVDQVVAGVQVQGRVRGPQGGRGRLQHVDPDPFRHLHRRLGQVGQGRQGRSAQVSQQD